MTRLGRLYEVVFVDSNNQKKKAQRQNTKYKKNKKKVKKMSIFRNRHRPRCRLDLRVGKSSHLVEVLFHLRRSDFDWYKENEDDIVDEILALMSRSVIPRMFGTIIESYHREHHPEIFPPDKVGKIGSKNKGKRSKQQRGKGMTTNDDTHKRQKTTTKRGGKKSTDAISNLQQEDNDDELDGKPIKDIYFAFGDGVQLAYKKEPLTTDTRSKTIFMSGWSNEKKSDESNGQSSSLLLSSSSSTSAASVKEKKNDNDGFYEIPKLPDRLLVWVSKIENPDAKTNPDLSGVGFYRPEMVPIADLFREPKGEAD